jgi:hypothetical protein
MIRKDFICKGVHISIHFEEWLLMVFEYKNSRGKTYYLHSKGRLFFFSKDPAGGIDKPDGYKVVESERTGLPMLKKE